MVAFLLNRYNHNILLLLKRNINGFVFCSSNPTYMCSILCHVTLSPTHTQTDTDTDTVSKADKCTHTHTYTHTHTQWVKQTPAKSRSHKKMYEKVFSTEIIYNSNYTPNHSDN